MDQLRKVEEFMEVMGQEIKSEPVILDEQTWNLRIGLIEEELKELKDAYKDRDKTEILDALGDLSYVLHGLILASGFKDEFKKAFQEIHDSNMSKTCSNLEDAEKSIDNLTEQFPGEAFYYELINDRYVIKRESDGKVMKGINYFKPVLWKSN